MRPLLLLLSAGGASAQWDLGANIGYHAQPFRNVLLPWEPLTEAPTTANPVDALLGELRESSTRNEQRARTATLVARMAAVRLARTRATAQSLNATLTNLIGAARASDAAQRSEIERATARASEARQALLVSSTSKLRAERAAANAEAEAVKERAAAKAATDAAAKAAAEAATAKREAAALREESEAFAELRGQYQREVSAKEVAETARARAEGEREAEWAALSNHTAAVEARLREEEARADEVREMMATQNVELREDLAAKKKAAAEEAAAKAATRALAAEAKAAEERERGQRELAEAAAADARASNDALVKERARLQAEAKAGAAKAAAEASGLKSKLDAAEKRAAAAEGTLKEVHAQYGKLYDQLTATQLELAQREAERRERSSAGRYLAPAYTPRPGDAKRPPSPNEASGMLYSA